MPSLGNLLTTGIMALGAVALAPRFAAAHADNPPGGPADLWSAWTLDPVVLAGVVALAGGYAVGVGGLWRRAGRGRGIGGWEAASFTAGMAAFFLAMIWPLDALGEVLFSAHMAQHIVLTAVVPPLLWLGRPVVLLWSLPRHLRRQVGTSLQARPVRRLWAWMTLPLPAFVLEGAILWGWHAPGAINAALRNEAIHGAMHLSFLIGGLLFWHSLSHAGHRRGVGYAETAALSFLTMMHTGLLGALLTFTTRPLYSGYGDSPMAWGLTPLEDQQVAGLIMWVICGTIYIVAGVLLLAAWLRQIERRAASTAPPYLRNNQSRSSSPVPHDLRGSSR